jgi:hypothetical protein
MAVWMLIPDKLDKGSKAPPWVLWCFSWPNGRQNQIATVMLAARF